MTVEELYTVAEVAKWAKVNTETIYRLIRSGSLKSVRVGGSLRIRLEDFYEYLKHKPIT